MRRRPLTKTQFFILLIKTLLNFNDFRSPWKNVFSKKKKMSIKLQIIYGRVQFFKLINHRFCARYRFIGKIVTLHFLIYKTYVKKKKTHFVNELLFSTSAYIRYSIFTLNLIDVLNASLFNPYFWTLKIIQK